MKCRRILSILAPVCMLPMRAVAAQTAEAPLASIRRIGPSDLRTIPAAVRAVLDARTCRVPQGAATGGENVLAGAFTGASRSEWATLCSVRDTSQILILASSGAVLDSLNRSADLDWVQKVSHERWVYSRRLTVVPAAAMRGWSRWGGERIPGVIDHDAINEAFEGKAATAYYFAAGRWYRRSTAD